MKRIKNIVIIVLCAVILSISILFVACNKTVDYNSIENFYGEYSIPLDKYYELTFWKHAEDGLQSFKYNIIGVKNSSFVYAYQENLASAYEYKEMSFDERLLAEADRLIDFMGDHVEFRKDSLYFCDSRQVVEFPTKDFSFNGSNGYDLMTGALFCQVYHSEENIYSVKYKKSIKVLYVSIESEIINDMDDKEWHIDISRKYKKYV